MAPLDLLLELPRGVLGLEKILKTNLIVSYRSMKSRDVFGLFTIQMEQAERTVPTCLRSQTVASAAAATWNSTDSGGLSLLDLNVHSILKKM